MLSWEKEVPPVDVTSFRSRGMGRVETMTQEAYIRSVAFFTCIVAGVVATGSVVSYGWPLSWPLLITTFAASIACIIVFQASENPVISFLGVSGMSAALGLMIGPSVAHYKMATVIQAVVITGVVMVVMSAIGILIPQVFRGWGPYLLAGLTLLIVAQFAQIIFMALGFSQAAHMPFLTWAGIALFVGYVAYDWSEALDKEYTLDNAIDASGGLILDAVNLFLRILSLSSGSSDD